MSNNKFKVLVVEDEANICSFIETLLETNGYQALVAHSCSMGLTLFASHNPDLVILDLGLPDRDGLELIRTVRQKYMTPIVVLSARTTEQDKIEALDLVPMIMSPSPLAPASCWHVSGPPCGSTATVRRAACPPGRLRHRTWRSTMSAVRCLWPGRRSS